MHRLGSEGPDASGSEEEDWVSGAGSHLEHQTAISAPLPAPSHATPARAFEIVRGKIMKRPANAMSLVAPSDESQPAGPPMLAGPPKLAHMMFGPRAAGAPESLLLSHMAMADACGIPPASFQRELCGLAYSAYTRLKTELADFVNHCLSSAGVSGAGEHKVLLQPLLFVRWRKDDETPLRLKVKVNTSAGKHASETTEGQQKLFVIEAGWGMCLRRICGSAASLVAITGDQPTTLTVVERNNAECIKLGIGATADAIRWRG